MGASVPSDSGLADRLAEVLATVPDPEIPVVSVIDLGIVRSIETAGTPRVTLTPTYTGCPATLVIEASVRAGLDDAGFSNVEIRTELYPPWTTDMITDAGREKLLAYGIAPPARNAALHSLRARETVHCPRCNSAGTREISRFGSTPCKALWQCDDCLEPFDKFKCH
ncbi:MAG: phenylacetate-CoA oxygenase subunit PaaJ [Candidatus Sphingomonas phytovorans]|nr:1,2-phenylacetyl-CoA epoxidase subunit PaaD [Sphingomonas sp.]WEK02554.1 MAG: phenylacetate-CoA oxygenase subunit PaaJ [Sphingomonas sp.]